MSPPVRQLRAVLFAAAIVGTLDILGALANYYANGGRTPVRVLQFIASGLQGRNAFSGGTASAALGLALHYLIALMFTAVFFALHARLALVRCSRVGAGLVYGLAVWAVMNLAVVPLSAAPSTALKLVPAMVSAGILVICLGWPLAWLAHRHAAQNPSDATLS